LGKHRSCLLELPKRFLTPKDNKSRPSGELGYIDRQATKLLDAHEGQEKKMAMKVQKSLDKIETLEKSRRDAETAMNAAVDAYDKSAANAEIDILKDANYMAQVSAVETSESTMARAIEKLEIAREDEAKKGLPYRSDKFFAYLQERDFGTKDAKGWFLTKLLDRWIAAKINYRQAAENYRRLIAIPKRLENHVARLEEGAVSAKEKLHLIESNFLKKAGVKAKHKASISAQKKMEDIDAKIAAAEDEHQDLRTEQSALTSGQAGPQKEAIALISSALQKKDLRGLRRLASQTSTRDDDRRVWFMI